MNVLLPAPQPPSVAGARWAMASPLLLALCLLLPHLPCIAPAALLPDSCSPSQPPCLAFIAYLTPSNLRLSTISLLFSVNWTTLVASNDFDPSTPHLSDSVVPASKLLFIPETCGCSNGNRVFTSVNYTVVPQDTLSTIASEYYSKLVTYQEIADANNISNVNMIFPGQTFIIPIPCACRNGTDQGHAAEFLTYEVQSGDDLTAIANQYNTTAADLQEINGLHSSTLEQSSIMFVPRRVCKANFSKGALDGNLPVPEGSSALTANNCVQCSCSSGSLYCYPTPSTIWSSCPELTCPSSNLTLGSYSTDNGPSGCTVQSCVYMGYTTAGIQKVLDTAVDPTCPGSPPPPSLYKPPQDIAAAPLGSTGSSGSGSGTSPPSSTSPPPSGISTPPTHSDSSSIVLSVFLSWFPTLGVSLWLNSWIPCRVL